MSAHGNWQSKSVVSTNPLLPRHPTLGPSCKQVDPIFFPNRTVSSLQSKWGPPPHHCTPTCSLSFPHQHFSDPLSAVRLFQNKRWGPNFQERELSRFCPFVLGIISCNRSFYKYRAQERSPSQNISSLSLLSLSKSVNLSEQESTGPRRMCGGAIISDFVPVKRGRKLTPDQELWSELDAFSDLLGVDHTFNYLNFSKPKPLSPPNKGNHQLF